jgi:hypothetical protein
MGIKETQVLREKFDKLLLDNEFKQAGWIIQSLDEKKDKALIDEFESKLTEAMMWYDDRQSKYREDSRGDLSEENYE